MKDQINTIREALNTAATWTTWPLGKETITKALAALTQLEAMVGAQEPIGEVVAIDSGDDEDGPHAIVALYGEVQLEAKLYTAAPVAQQPHLTELQKDVVPLLFALREAWIYVHAHCSIKSRKDEIHRLIVKHGDFAEFWEEYEATKKPQAEAVRPTTQQIKAAWASPDLPLAPPTPIYNFVDRLFDAMQIKQAEAVSSAMSQPNRLIAYSAAAKLRELGYQWDEKAKAWAPQPVVPKCSCCGTTENLHADYGSGGPWRCSSPDCMVF